MRGSGFVQLAVTAAVLIVFNLPPGLGNTAAQDSGARGTQAGGGFKEMLALVDAAQMELQRGRPAAFKALWSRADDVTLFGGFGGTVEMGWGRSADASTGSARSSRRERTPSSGSWRTRAATSGTSCSSSTSVSTRRGRRRSRGATTE